MAQLKDPFVGLNWGWNDGEDAWGTGMNETLIISSFFHNKRIDSIIATSASLPVSPADGVAYFSTGEKTCYLRANSNWYSIIVPLGMEFTLKSTEDVYKFNGTDLVLKTLDDFGVTPYASTLLAAANAAAARTTLELGNVNNTTDLNKPISTATQTALDGKVPVVGGKGLSTEDYTTVEKAKLSGIATGATANSSDATLLARANHIGTQAISTVTGLQTALDNKLDDSQLGANNGVASLDSSGKVPSSQLPVSGSYLGVWNANTNSPTITSSTGTNGDFYRVSVAGSTSIDGISSWTVGDEVKFNGTVWERIPNSAAVSSVAGKTGAVTLVPADVGITIGTNVQAWDGDLDAIAALSGTSGLIRKTAANTYSLETSSYLTGNQSITLSGDISGSGTTAITATLPATGVSNGTYKSVTVNTKGLVTGGTNPTTLAGYGITDAAPFSHIGTGGSQHADATTSVSGFLSGANLVKLNSIATGATANSSDATLLARVNHTGTQLSSTISDLTESVQDIMSTTLVAGTNITLSYNDGANTLTINSSGGGGGSSTFTGLTDTPANYTTQALKVVRVNAGETALEFTALGTAAFNNTGDFAGSSHIHDGTAIVSGTVADARLPSTMSGKTFTSNVALQNNLNFTGTAQRITGDFTNSTHGNRVLFQTITPNVSTGVGIIANGSGGGGFLNVYSGSDANNATLGQFYAQNSGVVINSTKTGTGVTQAIYAKIDGVNAVTITTARNLLVGTDIDSGYRLDVSGAGRLTDDLILGTGVGQRILRINGGSSGVADGGAVHFGGSGTYTGAVGYQSAIIGGAFNQNIGLYSNNDLIFTAGGGANIRATVKSNGNVLIGTTTDNTTDKLQVSGSSNFSSHVKSGGDLAFSGNGWAYSYAGGSFGSALRSGINFNGSSQLIDFYSGGNFGARLTSDSNLLLGTTSNTGDRLHVAGNARISNLTLVGNSLSFGASAIGFISNTANSSEIHLRDNVGDFQGALSSTNTYIGLSDSGANLKLYVSHGGDTFCTTNFTGSSRISASGAQGFASSTYEVNARNPIWRFGNADGVGLSYFHGTAGDSGYDVIGIHFGTATTATSGFKFRQDGTLTASSFVGSGSGLTGLTYSQLSWTPVQQGGGIGQTTNKLYLGWSGAGKLKCTVDSTDLGALALESWASNASNLSSGTVPNARLQAGNTAVAGILQVIDSVSDSSVTAAASPNSVRSVWLTATGASTLANSAVQKATPSQTFQSIGTVSGSVTINGANGTHVLATVNGNTTWTFPSPSVTEALALTLELTNGGAFTMTWPAGIRWTGGVAPVNDATGLTASGTDVLVFTKAGSNAWRGYFSSKDSK